ncbi:aspartyl protease family protein [Mucilaginibacter sp. UR6-11]|uniref:aspartyl protease family protein n=1 Tax=Mucilaginibacter sp. UR6-11 TaxID=1435644 RepID=UPI001E4BAA5A|nr:aspartyl protease family protein [Mucilaginibacter sp. UR6-11]MCC8423597.1 retropepsin-like domain-containing protein [Mucilaginibacter sp. UR6-11]
MISKISGIAIICLGLWAGPATAQVTRVPFEMNGSRMFLKVRVGQSDSLRFMFDTGGGEGVLIDSLTAEQAGVSRTDRKSTEAVGVGGAQSAVSIPHQDIFLSKNLPLKDVELTLMNLGQMNTGSATPIRGIIGYDLFHRYITQIDFDQRQLLLYEDIRKVDTAGYKVIPFEFKEGIMVPRIPVTITLAGGEQLSGKAIFDSGANINLLIFAPFNNYYGLGAKTGATAALPGRGLNQPTRDLRASVKAMDIGGFHFGGDIPVRINVDVNAGQNKEYLGLLGFQMIRHFNVILDYANQVIYLKSNHVLN